ncbi:hypothetical protein VTJ49DRAFT_3738 [Mycothermus thermophilus]|uniref:Mif2/CENP-C cupin domain-containing protein n=1 Tax=Humicola insolens TaxID=85995 RepID=A0ABR3V6U8_HUMIN
MPVRPLLCGNRHRKTIPDSSDEEWTPSRHSSQQPDKSSGYPSDDGELDSHGDEAIDSSDDKDVESSDSGKIESFDEENNGATEKRCGQRAIEDLPASLRQGISGRAATGPIDRQPAGQAIFAPVIDNANYKTWTDSGNALKTCENCTRPSTVWGITSGHYADPGPGNGRNARGGSAKPPMIVSRRPITEEESPIVEPGLHEKISGGFQVKKDDDPEAKYQGCHQLESSDEAEEKNDVDSKANTMGDSMQASHENTPAQASEQQLVYAETNGSGSDEAEDNGDGHSVSEHDEQPVELSSHCPKSAGRITTHEANTLSIERELQMQPWEHGDGRLLDASGKAIALSATSAPSSSGTQRPANIFSGINFTSVSSNYLRVSSGQSHQLPQDAEQARVVIVYRGQLSVQIGDDENDIETFVVGPTGSFRILPGKTRVVKNRGYYDVVIQVMVMD